MKFTEAEIAYMASQTLGRLATAQRNGTLQNSPVGFTYNADLDTVDITGHGMSGSQKYRNVGTNSRVAFVVDDIASRQPWRIRCLEIRGTAEGRRRGRPPRLRWRDHPDHADTDHQLRPDRLGRSLPQRSQQARRLRPRKVDRSRPGQLPTA